MQKALVYATVLADRVLEKYASPDVDETWVWKSAVIGKIPAVLRPQETKMLHLGATFFQCTFLMTTQHVGFRMHYGRPPVPHTSDGQPIH
jgi:hypothetical protein